MYTSNSISAVSSPGSCDDTCTTTTRFPRHPRGCLTRPHRGTPHIGSRPALTMEGLELYDTDGHRLGEQRTCNRCQTGAGLSLSIIRRFFDCPKADLSGENSTGVYYFDPVEARIRTSTFECWQGNEIRIPKTGFRDGREIWVPTAWRPTSTDQYLKPIDRDLCMFNPP